MKQLKFYRIKSLGLLVSIFLSSSAVATEPVKDPLACGFSVSDGQMITIKITNTDIEGAVLSFPKGYDNSAGKNTSVRDGVLLRAFNDTFKPYPKSKLLQPNGSSKLLAGIHDKLAILLTAYVPIQKIAENYVSSEYLSSLQSGQITNLDNPEFRGLFRSPKKSTKGYFQDVFLATNENIVTDVISCNKLGSVPIPHCSHIFESNHYDIKITYPRTQFPRWKELKTGTEKLFQCFTIKQPKQIKGK